MLLTVRNLEKSVTSADVDITVLHSIDLDLAHGETLALTGESGSGKSTLLHHNHPICVRWIIVSTNKVSLPCNKLCDTTVVGLPFSEDVLAEDYEESWTQEIQVFHNPNAKIPLPFESLMGASHHYFEDGYLRSFMPDDAILSSFTMLMKYVSDEEFEERND